MIIDRASSKPYFVRLFVFLSFAVFSVGTAFGSSRAQKTQTSEGQISTQPKGQQLWKLETGG